jgi:hypothetical protein
MAQMATRYNDLDLVPRGYKINPDWNRNFREVQDKKTRMFEQILDMTIREHTKYNRTTLEDVYFTKYWGWGNYCLIFKMKEDYDNLELLFGSVLETTDDALSWYDVTEFVNFNVYIITPYRTFRLTYLDLLYEYVTMNHNRVSPSRINNHPRIRKMIQWVSRYVEYERHTKKGTPYDPYSYSEIGKEQMEYLRLRNDNRRLPPQEYRGLGIQPGYHNYDIDNLRRDQRILQQMGEIMEPRPIVEKESLMTRIKSKIRW